MTSHSDVAVVGGGLAGLTVAHELACAGFPVTLYDRKRKLGGRAGTALKDDFALDQGPHALYLGGATNRYLTSLGITMRGATPDRDLFGDLEGKAYPLPTGVWSGLRTKLLGLSDLVKVNSMVGELVRADRSALARVTVADWLDERRPSTRARAVMEAFLRVSTYANDPTRMSADVAALQLGLARSAGVRYVDGGWQAIVDALEGRATAAGAQIRRGLDVRSVDFTGAERGVKLEDGTRMKHDLVVICAGPKVAAELTRSDELRRIAARTRPVLAATIGVALSEVPVPSTRLLLGIDSPLYCSLFSATAKVAPEGAGLLQLAKYLGPNEPSPSDTDEMEALADRAQPGWRDRVVHRQDLRSMVVVNALATAEGGGLRGRPGIDAAAIEGVYLAGDWIGPEGWLADASVASARSVAERIAKEHRRVRMSA
jgi:phytoene dehydrogenase-like protein